MCHICCDEKSYNVPLHDLIGKQQLVNRNITPSGRIWWVVLVQHIVSSRRKVLYWPNPKLPEQIHPVCWPWMGRWLWQCKTCSVKPPKHFYLMSLCQLACVIFNFLVFELWKSAHKVQYPCLHSRGLLSWAVLHGKSEKEDKGRKFKSILFYKMRVNSF